jgi:hypothetical protein
MHAYDAAGWENLFVAEAAVLPFLVTGASLLLGAGGGLD